MYTNLVSFIKQLDFEQIETPRKELLNDIAAEFQRRSNANNRININCICTHNSRRSHLCQVWSKVASMHYRIRKVNSYSGGTESTRIKDQILETLKKQGMQVHALSEGNNPVFAIKYDASAPPIHVFSKKYSHQYNPEEDFYAFMNCSDADENCPVVFGATKRWKVNYLDPKRSDDSAEQAEVYAETSIRIAREMFYLFSQISK